MDTVALGRFRRMITGGDIQQMAQMFMGGGAVWRFDRLESAPG